MKTFSPVTVTAAAARTGEIIKNGPVVFEEEKICYKMVYYTLCLG